MQEHLIKVFEKRFRDAVNINQMQLSSMPGRGGINAIVSFRQIVEKYETAGKTLYSICEPGKGI